MHKKLLLICFTALSFITCASSFATNFNPFIVTASSTAVLPPIEYEGPVLYQELILQHSAQVEAHFQISSAPITQQVEADKVAHVSLGAVGNEDGSGEVYICGNRDGSNMLTLNYAKGNQATIKFSGTPFYYDGGYGVQCQCTGSACSTQEPVNAALEK